MIDSITGASLVRTTRADSVRVTIAGRASGGYTVWYTVAAGDTAVDVERLRARHVAEAAWTDTGWVEMMVSFPLTRGSSRKFLPVICDTVLTTAWMSASWKLNIISPGRNAGAG